MNDKFIILAACFMLGSMFSPLAYSFEIEDIEVTFDNVNNYSYETFDLTKIVLSIFNGGEQPAHLSGHSMIYLNDTEGDYWEYSSYVDLVGFTYDDCPYLDVTINASSSASVKLCYILPKSDTAYSVVLNNHPVLEEHSTKTVSLEYAPDWHKFTADAWCLGQISDTEYLNSVQYLIDDGKIIIIAPQMQQVASEIPGWIRDNSCLWANDQINHYEYLDGISWLVENDFIHVTN